MSMQNIQIGSYNKRVYKRVHCLLLTKIVMLNTKNKREKIRSLYLLKIQVVCTKN